MHSHFNPPQAGCHDGSLLASMLSSPRATVETSHSNQLDLYLVLKLLSSLDFYKTILPWLCPTCPPIYSPCISLDDLKCKLYPCSNFPTASKSPANLSRIRIMPLSSMLTALPSHLDSFYFQALRVLAHFVLSVPFLPNPNSSLSSILI